MNIWEFRKIVRERRVLLNHCCPLGAALSDSASNNPWAFRASEALNLPLNYCLGVVCGWDGAEMSESTASNSEVLRGKRFGQRMRKIVEAKPK